MTLDTVVILTIVTALVAFVALLLLLHLIVSESVSLVARRFKRRRIGSGADLEATAARRVAERRTHHWTAGTHRQAPTTDSRLIDRPRRSSGG